MHVLLVEDDLSIGRSVRQGLNESHIECTWVRDGIRGLEEAETLRFDALILDILLPGKSGIELVQALRGRGIRTPIVLLTALGSVDDRVAGLNAGADDYIVKPFALPELKARLLAIMRRSNDRPSPVLEVNNLCLDLATRRVTRNGNVIELTPTEFSLLEFLMRYAGQIVTRRMLCEHLWNADWEGATNVIEVHINRLRGKVDVASEKSLIQTVRGRGYTIPAPRGAEVPIAAGSATDGATAS